MFDDIIPFDSSKYADINLDRLTVFGVKCLDDRGIECTFENLTVILFKLFPGKFSLVGFPQYPDSLRVNNSIALHCRPKYKDYAVGTKQRGWELTEKGIKAAKETQDELLGKSEKISKKKGQKMAPTSRERTKIIHFVKEVESSIAFNKYSSGETGNIEKYDICDMLHGSLDTQSDLLKTNLKRLIEYSSSVQNDRVSNFLKFIKDNWRTLMHEK